MLSLTLISKSVLTCSVLIIVLICQNVASELVINVRINQQSDKNFDFIDENGISVQNFASSDDSEPMGFIR